MVDRTVMQSGRYKAYPEYKDSGVEWLGEIPTGWDTASLSKLFVIKAGGDLQQSIYSEFKTDEHKYPIYTNANDDKAVYGYTKIASYPSDSITVSGRGEVGFAVFRDHEFDAIIRLLVLIPNYKEELDGRFFAYFINEVIDFKVQSSAIGQLSTLQISPYKVFIPPTEEQIKIANYLDYETAKIDTLIEKQQCLIELLTEKRQAVISHAVTKGLNPDVPMKDSGVEWLGEVPVHWEVKEIKFQLKSLNSRRIPINSQDRGDREGIYRYYGASGVIDYIDDYIFDEPTVLVGEDGANLLSRSTPLAFSAHGKYWVNNHAHILEAKDGLADFWAEVIDIIDVTPIVTGSAQPKLTAEALSNLKIAFPPTVKERKEIESFIHSSKHKYGELIGYAKKAIQLMQERRTALISAAVTGKIDVRDWVKPE